MNELEDTRKKIGVLDAEMARIFVERMKLVEDVAGYKKRNGLPVHDPVREAAVLERNATYVWLTIRYSRSIMHLSSRT